MSTTNDTEASTFPIPTLILTKLSVPSESYVCEPSDTIIINLTLHPTVLVTCSTVGGHKLGYFGWDKGDVDIGFESDTEVVISYSATPTIWSSGQRVPETKDYLSERSWFHTFINVVSRGISDGNGAMRLTVKALPDEYENSGGGAADGFEQGTRDTSPKLSSSLRRMKSGRDKKRVVNGKIGKTGKVKKSSIDRAEAIKKLLHPLEKLQI